MSAKSSNAKLENTSKEWPGAFGAFKYSKQAVMLNLGNIIILLIASYAVGSIINALTGNNNSTNISEMFSSRAVFGLFLASLVAYYFQIAIVMNYLSGASNKKTELGDTLNKAFPFYVDFVIMNVLRSIILMLSFIAFVIPFFFVLPRLILADYFLIDKKMTAIEALKASWNGTKGNSLKVYGIFGAVIVMCLPVITVIGIIVTVPLLVLYSAVLAILYKNISAK
jgi:hypothetical protein